MVVSALRSEIIQQKKLLLEAFHSGQLLLFFTGMVPWEGTALPLGDTRMVP